MNDRKILELAAKAADYRVWVRDNRCDIWHPNTEWTAWNPLTDDGDSLRLAVKLNLNLNINTPSPWFTNNDDHLYCDASWWDGYAENWQSVDFKLSEGGDPCAATRRAIVRAAAEIGRSKK